MLATILLLSLDVPRPDPSFVPALDLPRLSFPAALDLDGKRVRVRATFPAWSLPADYGDGFVREAAGPEDESRTAHFARGEQPDWTADSLVVEGVVKVVRHKAAVHEGQEFAGFVEVRVMGRGWFGESHTTQITTTSA